MLFKIIILRRQWNKTRFAGYRLEFLFQPFLFSSLNKIKIGCYKVPVNKTLLGEGLSAKKVNCGIGIHRELAQAAILSNQQFFGAKCGAFAFNATL